MATNEKEVAAQFSQARLPVDLLEELRQAARALSYTRREDVPIYHVIREAFDTWIAVHPEITEKA